MEWTRTQPGGPESAATDASIDESEIIARAQRDAQAFAPLYARYVVPVYRYCYRRLGSHEAAEDATSQVFLKALDGLHRYRGGTFRAWLFTIARNVVNDSFRRYRRVEPLETADERADGAATPEETALVVEEQRQVHALVSQLPTAQRDVVELRLAGLTGVEIARVLGRSHGSVRTLQSRALARLRELAGGTTNPEERQDGTGSDR